MEEKTELSVEERLIRFIQGEEENAKLREGETVDPQKVSGLKEALGEILSSLGERESQIMRFYLGLEDGRPRTLGEIGLKLGITRERVRQIVSKAVRRMRHPARLTRFEELLKEKGIIARK